MPIDVESPEGKAFKNLARMLHERRTGRRGGRVWTLERSDTSDLRPGLDLLWDYRRGDPPLSRVHAGWKPYVRQFVRTGRFNIADLLISSTRNRMDLRDFRTSAANDELGDAEARKIMRVNALPIVASDVHDFLLWAGDAYTMTTPPAKKGGTAAITAEDPRFTITADDPVTGQPLYGYKAFRDDWDSADMAYVFFPGGVVKRAIRKGATSFTSGSFRFDAKGWEWDDSYGSNGSETMPDGRFPIVHFENERGVGEFEEHLDTLNRINDKIFNEWWISKIQAFRQRAVKNLPDTVDEVQNDGTVKEVDADYTDMFTASPDEMWQVPGDVEFWESAPVDVGPIVTSIQKDLERLAAAKSQPLHTITPDAANGSAEGASLMREEHLYKVGNRIARVNPRWAQTMSNAFLFQGDAARADVSQIEGIWGPIQRYSLEAQADFLSKVGDKLPVEAIWTDVLQYAPAEVPNLRTLQGRDLLYLARQAAIGQPPAPPAPPTPPAPPAPPAPGQ